MVLGPTTGVCLVAVGLMQDVTLILSTKKHQAKQNKERKKTSKNSSTAKGSGEGFIMMDIYAVYYCQQQHP